LHGYPNDVVSVGEPPVADYEPEALPKAASDGAVLIRRYSRFDAAPLTAARKGAR
jgi:hypothetical protein